MVYQKKVPKWFRRMKIKSTFSFPAPVVVLVGPYTPNWWTGLSSGDSKDVFVFVSVTVDFTPCSWDRTHSGAAAWATDHFKWGNLRLVFKVNRFHDDQQPDSVTVRPRHDFVFVFSFRSEDTVASQTTSVFASWSEGDEGVQMVWLSVCDDIITPAAHRPRQYLIRPDFTALLCHRWEVFTSTDLWPVSSWTNSLDGGRVTAVWWSQGSAGKLFTWTTIKCHGRLALPALWSR